MLESLITFLEDHTNFAVFFSVGILVYVLIDRFFVFSMFKQLENDYNSLLDSYIKVVNENKKLRGEN